MRMFAGLISLCRMAGLRVCRCRRPRATPLISTSSFTTSGRVSAACFGCWGALTMPAAMRASVCGLGFGEGGRGRGDLWWWMSMSKVPRLHSSSTRHQSPPSCMVGKQGEQQPQLESRSCQNINSTSDILMAQASGFLKKDHLAIDAPTAKHMRLGARHSVSSVPSIAAQLWFPQLPDHATTAVA